MDIDSKDLRGSHKNGVVKACDELRGKTKARGSRGNTWWWYVVLIILMTASKIFKGGLIEVCMQILLK